MGGGSHQTYGGSSANTSSYDGRMEANRYMQPQAARGGYPSYGLFGYGSPSYGYGAANNGVGYGGYGVGGYGSPNAPPARYVSGPPVGLRSPWNNLN